LLVAGCWLIVIKLFLISGLKKTGSNWCYLCDTSWCTLWSFMVKWFIFNHKVTQRFH